MAYCKKDATPLLTYWSYVFRALPNQYDLNPIAFMTWLIVAFIHGNYYDNIGLQTMVTIENNNIYFECLNL